MSTRLKRPAFWRHLMLTLGLVAFQGYLGFNVVSGQFGIESQRQMHADIEELKAQSGALQAEIDAYRHRVELFNPARLDPDIVSERARALLSMAQADDIVVMVDPKSGKPLSGSSEELASGKLTEIIEDDID
ncbi:MAG: septum formation initiator family protein [Devosia sp.]|nr:septum formation initiator family protein [Devosia sp.]